MFTYLEEMESGATEGGDFKALQDLHAEDEKTVLQRLIREMEQLAEGPTPLGDAGRAWLEELADTWRRRLGSTLETPRTHRLLRVATSASMRRRHRGCVRPPLAGRWSGL